MLCETHERPTALVVSPSKGNQGTTRGKEKILLTSVGIEPTTSGLDLPLLCRLSYEVGQRKSGTIEVVNRGEEKVGIHMNVVPYPYFLFVAIHHLNRPRLFPSDLVAQSAE